MAHYYEFAAPSGRFTASSAIDIAEPIGFYAGLWPWRTIAPVAAPDIEIDAAAGGGARLRHGGAAETVQDASSGMETAAALFDMLARLCLERLDAFADVHAGSALIDGRLVLFPGPGHAGKSTLALQLMARGHVLGGDDRLLIGPLRKNATAEAWLLGMNARLRLPIDPRAGRDFADRMGPLLMPAPLVMASIGFVAPPPAGVAGFGQRAPIAAILLLQRRDAGGVALEPASFSDIMRGLLEQAHAPHLSALELTEAVRRLARERPGFTLRFDDSAAAAAAVERLVRSDFRDLGE